MPVGSIPMTGKATFSNIPKNAAHVHFECQLERCWSWVTWEHSQSSHQGYSNN